MSRRVNVDSCHTYLREKWEMFSIRCFLVYLSENGEVRGGRYPEDFLYVFVLWEDCVVANNNGKMGLIVHQCHLKIIVTGGTISG